MASTPRHPLVLDVRDLTVEYRDEGRIVRAVTGLDFGVVRARTVALIGESGSGKTTAALAILGMLPDNAMVLSGSARVTADGRSVELLGMAAEQLRAMRWRHVAYVPQGSISALNPIQRVRTHFLQTARAHGMTRSDAEARAEVLLPAVHLDPARILNAYPHELSGGTRQRVAIALAMLLEPAVIVLDEPTTALDVLTQDAVLTTLLELQRATGVSYVLITHDLGVAAAMADDIVTMYDGEAVEHGDAHRVLTAPRHPYTQSLLAAMPRLDAGGGRA
jgi:peptide/nickel transport system ATP-binding protein